MPSFQQEETAAVVTESFFLADETVPETERAAETAAAAEATWTPTVTELNLSHFFPEDVTDHSDLTQSYGGKAFKMLMEHDEDWMGRIYDYADVTPAQMAQRLGRSSQSVLGDYNPNDSSHDPDDPNTWTVNHFKDIRMTATDGDGNPVTPYSNVFEIMSMASVYTWYTGIEDYDLFVSYAKELWDQSHSYTVGMSEVYYCSGCIGEDAEQKEMEALEEEAKAEALGLREEAIPEAVSDEAASASADDSEILLVESGVIEAGKTARESESESELTEESSTETESDLARESSAEAESDLIRETAAKAESDLTRETSAKAESDLTRESSAKAESDLARESSAEVESDMIRESSAEVETTAVTESSAESGTSVITAGIRMGQETETTTSGSESSSGFDVDQTSGNAMISQNSETDAADASPSDAAASGQRSRSESEASETSQHDSRCPGHVDLIIRMKITGLNGQHNLFDEDTIGNRKDSVTESEISPEKDGNSEAAGDSAENDLKAIWPGWTPYTRACARALSKQDWFERYGLTVSLISGGNPLSQAEIDSYLSMLPDDLSGDRRAIIAFALGSVGRVPYYWGGKASVPNYEGNNFGILTGPDYKGRVLRGLDCSGWINWVYWSVTGNRLPYESTAGLAVCGTRISRGELQPGDIILRTGTDAHVIMFLGWTADGQIQCIHESSARVNNVTIGVRDANWPYYRKLVE